jgi:hypothetical protein
LYIIRAQGVNGSAADIIKRITDAMKKRRGKSLFKKVSIDNLRFYSKIEKFLESPMACMGRILFIQPVIRHLNPRRFSRSHCPSTTRSAQRRLWWLASSCAFGPCRRFSALLIFKLLCDKMLKKLKAKESAGKHCLHVLQ